METEIHEVPVTSNEKPILGDEKDFVVIDLDPKYISEGDTKLGNAEADFSHEFGKIRQDLNNVVSMVDRLYKRIMKMKPPTTSNIKNGTPVPEKTRVETINPKSTLSQAIDRSLENVESWKDRHIYD